MFTLAELGYDYNALEPHIDAQTMEIHHSKHHNAYVTKLNEAVGGYDDLKDKSIEELLSDANNLPENIKQAVINNGGGHHNHSLFWETMKPGGPPKPSENLLKAINNAFGSLEKLQTSVNDAGIARFGSGWSWLVSNGGKLEVYTTANQDSPLMEGKVPLLGVDVWEHAYYLKYQNRRPDYLTAWWNVVNWDEVEARLV
jgi:superoxide dismutase, Fe-Mn family